MEILSEMLSKRQLELIKKEFKNNDAQRAFKVNDGAMLCHINQVDDFRHRQVKIYREMGTTHRWRLVFDKGEIIGVFRDPCYFANA